MRLGAFYNAALIAIEPCGPRLVALENGEENATKSPVHVSPMEMSPAERPSDTTDRALVESVLARSPGSFEELVRKYQGLCWHIINRLVRDPHETEDLCQETFLRIYRYLRQYRFESALKSWIGRVAYTVALRHMEKKRIPLVSPAEESVGNLELGEISSDFDLEAASANAELVAALHIEIEALPPLQRMLLTLYYLREMSIAELASVTSIPEGTIKNYLFRSRAKLRSRLQARFGESQ